MHVARRLCVSLAKFERPLSTLNTFAKSEFSCSSSSSSSFRCMNTMSDWQMHNGVDLVKWLDTSVVNRQGRLFEPEKSLIPADKAIAFPPIECQCLLDGRDATVPSDSFGKTKLVVFSFRHYGFSLLRSWMDSFTAKIEPKLPKDAIDIIEVCFVEAGMFSLAKNMMSRSLRSKVESRRLNRTYVMFGGVMDIARKLSLTNVYTGYVYLVDEDNRVRWRGSGEPTDADLALLSRMVDELHKEGQEKAF